MDFNDSPDEAAFRAEVRAWLEANAPRKAPGASNVSVLEGATPEQIASSKAWQKLKAEKGYAAISWPKEYGGMAGNPMQNVIYAQEESQFGVSSDLFTIGIGFTAPTLMVLGSNAQKTRFIKPALYGEEIWCQLFSEPAAGSDLAGAKTRAEKDGDEWVVNGSKIWTTLGHVADWGILVARTDPNKPKHKGLSFFLLDMKTPGITVKQIRQISGASGFNEIFFENVRIPDAMRVGPEGGGWRAALEVLMNERVIVGQMSGGSQGIEDILRLARVTELEDGPAIANAAVREKIADWYVQAKGLKYINYRTLTAISRGVTPGVENAIGKAVGAVYGQELPAFAMELMDLGGIIRDPDISPQAAGFQESWIMSPALRIGGGTDEILKNIIAEQVMGLPGDIRVDKDVAFNALPTGR